MRHNKPIDNYRLIQKKSDQTEENEIRVKSQGRQFYYAAYAGKLLFEKKHEMIYMLATGSATAKVIQAVEYLRKRVKGLHVAYQIESTKFVDEYEPLQEGLDKVTVERLVATLKARVTLTKKEEICNLPGYMTPLDESELLDEQKFKDDVENHFNKDRPKQDRKNSGHYRGRGRGRGYRGRGRGRGYRGRGYRGRGRGYRGRGYNRGRNNYNNQYNQYNNQYTQDRDNNYNQDRDNNYNQDYDNNYNQDYEQKPRGRGRGRGYRGRGYRGRGRGRGYNRSYGRGRGQDY